MLWTHKINKNARNFLARENIEHRHLLHQAVRCGKIMLAEQLLEAGALVNAIDDKGWAPLHLAGAPDLREESPELIRLLLSRGADVHQTSTGEWRTPLHTLAEGNGSETAARLLLRAGADPLEPDRRTFTAYQLTILHGNTNMALLIEAQPSVKKLLSEMLIK